MQQHEVLTFKSRNGDYEVIVRTGDISYAWQNFKGRIDYRNDLSDKKSDPYHYCRYISSGDCEIQVMPVETDIAEDESGLKWPVVFETNPYQIVIKLHGIEDEFTPRVVHIRKDVEGLFFPDNDAVGEARLTGTISFLNEPGFFKLNFEYKKNGRVQREYVAFDVVSPKLDTRHDYKRILDDVNHEFEGLVFNYLSTTFQQFGRGREKKLEIWMQVFQQVVKDYLKSIDLIVKNPHSKVRTHEQFDKADRIKKWTPAMEEEYMETRAAAKLDEHYFAYNVYETTVNSLENRFVKYTLKQIGADLAKVFETLLKSNADVSDNFVQEWKEYQYKINKYLKHPFFKSVGRFEGLRQESLVLQSRMGYQQVYKDWLKLRKGVDFYNGATDIGTLQIWEIYELWCFLKMKRIVRNLLCYDPKKSDSEYGSLITEPNGKLINYTKEKKTDYRIVYRYPNPDEVQLVEGITEEQKELLRKHQGEEVSLHYQHVFKRQREDDFMYRTVTSEQRPDIVLNIKRPEIELTYLYDAKYRVWSDPQLDKELEEQDRIEMEDILKEDNADLTEDQKRYGADYPPSDAINQMHRYRDAIYYGMNAQDRPESKEIIGGYILFPGRGDDSKIKERYYYRSIEKVNIGAFPLLPRQGTKDSLGRDVEAPQLWEHLEDILLKKEQPISHVKDAVPQRGLHYSEEVPRGLYLVSSIGGIRAGLNERSKVLQSGEAKYFVMGYLPPEDIDFLKIKYFIPVVNHKIYGYYHVDSINPFMEEGAIRFRLSLSNYIPFKTTILFGIDKLAIKGFCVTEEQIEKGLAAGTMGIS